MNRYSMAPAWRVGRWLFCRIICSRAEGEAATAAAPDASSASPYPQGTKMVEMPWSAAPATSWLRSPTIAGLRDVDAVGIETEQQFGNDVRLGGPSLAV